MLSDRYYRRLGRTGLMVSPICLGTDNFANPTPEAECLEMLAFAHQHAGGQW